MKIEIENMKDILLLQMSMVLQYAVSRYGKEGGPWNIPGTRGSWIELARNTLYLYDKVVDAEMESSMEE